MVAALPAWDLPAWDGTVLSERIQRFEYLNAFVEVDWQSLTSSGKRTGSLANFPVGIKDIIPVAGLKLEAGSKVLSGNRAEADAPIVQRLRQLGATIIGKLKTHEFAMGDPQPEGELATGVHPWNSAFAPGGSSSGAAVAVAAGLCRVALGSDTGGSIRGPASACGVVGYVPGSSALPRRGVIPLCWTLDRLGWMAKTIADVEAVHSAVTGIKIGNVHGQLRVGRPADVWLGHVESVIWSAFEQALERIRVAGADIRTVELPSRDGVDPAWLAHLPEAYQYHAERLADPGTPYSVKLRNQLEEAGEAPVEFYLKAIDFRRRFTEDFTRAMAAIDVLVLPATPFPALPRDTGGQDIEPWFSLATPFSLTGQPCLSLPCGWDNESVPIGLQLVTPLRGKYDILAIGRWVETALEFPMRTIEPLG